MNRWLVGLATWFIVAAPAAAQQRPDAPGGQVDGGKKAAEASKTAEVPKPAAERGERSWAGTATIGFINLTGNARSTSTSGAIRVEFQSYGWLGALDLAGNYGRARPAATGGPLEVVAEDATARLRGDRRLSRVYSVYLLGGVDTDHVKSIEVRPYGEAGFSALWIDQVVEGEFVKARVQTDLGLRFGHEWRFQYFPTRENLENVRILAPKAGARARYALSRDLVVSEVFEVLPSLLSPYQVYIDSVTKLGANLWRGLGVGVAYQIRYESKPPPGKVPLDTALTVGLEAAF